MRRTICYILLLIFSNACLQAQITDFKSIDFTKADSIARLNKDASINNLPLLAYKLTNKLPTQVEKFRAIYVWVCQNIKGDNSQSNRVISRRKKFKNDSIAFMQWNERYNKVFFKKLLKHRKTMCTGYAYLIKELCFLANIKSVIVDGYGRTAEANVNKLELANHSWNAVWLNDKWYLCDATWSSGYTDQYSIFIEEYNNGYFLTDSMLFGKSHFPLEEKWLLTENISALQFINAPLVYGEAFKHRIMPMNPQQMSMSISKNDEIEFSFRVGKEVLNENVSLVHYIGFQEKKLKIYDTKNQKNSVSFKYKFEHKGTYDTHLKVNDDIVATYTIKVTNATSK